MTDPLRDDGRWHPLDGAPRDGTMVWLMVDYTHGSCPLVDSRCTATIGFNSRDHTGEDVWEFVAWSWEQDHFHSHTCRDAEAADGARPFAWRPIGFDLDHDDLSEAALTAGEE